MPTSLCPPNTPHASFSRRSFFALAATAASYAALGPVAFERAPLDHASQHLLSRQAWTAETRSPHNTIEGILGATRCALDELKAHEYDSYYLGTPYGNTGPDGAGGDISTWDCWHPNGKPKSNGQAYMNCTGFIVAVLEACGANCEPIGSYVGSSGYNRGNKSNLSRWISYLNDHSELRTRYESKESMLAAASCVKATSSSPIRSIGERLAPIATFCSSGATRRTTTWHGIRQAMQTAWLQEHAPAT